LLYSFAIEPDYNVHFLPLLYLDYQNIPIITHTSCGESARNDAIEGLMNDLVTKPSTKEVFLERVGYCLYRQTK